MKHFKWLIIFSLFIITIGLLLYFSVYNFGFSQISSDWANFAIFNSYFINIVSLVILGYISYLSYITTKRFNLLQLQPVLFLTIESPEKIKNVFKDSWYLNNGTKYPATNLLVRFSVNRKNDQFTKWISCWSLAEGQKLELFWIQYADIIEASYSNMSNERFYLLRCSDNTLVTKEINKYEYSQFLKEASDNNNLPFLLDEIEKFIKEHTDPRNEYLEEFIKKNLH